MATESKCTIFKKYTKTRENADRFAGLMDRIKGEISEGMCQDKEGKEGISPKYLDRKLELNSKVFVLFATESTCVSKEVQIK